LDENVIPYLLYNLAIRNMEATVMRADVLKNEVYESWEVKKGEKYGKCIAIKSAV
jgi:N-6 DNA methylase